MSDKAGHLFRCVCCDEEHDENVAVFDQQLAGPLCPECRKNSLWATAYLKKEGIDRPIVVGDINDSNSKRFST